MNDRNKKITIIGGGVVGGLALLYLIGLIGQYISKYTAWVTGGGMYGGTEMEKMSFSLFECLKYSFSLNGLKAFLIIALLVGGVFAWYKLHDKFRQGREDERGVNFSETGDYGTADEMTEEAMREIFEVTSIALAKGTILGEKNGKVVCMPVDTYLNRNIFLCGKAGSMKSRAIVRPYIFQVIKRGESAVVTDPKGEMYKDTAHLARSNGYKVKVLNLISPNNSDSFNCLSGVGDDVLMIRTIANVIIGNTSKGTSDQFFADNDENLLEGLIAVVTCDSKLEEEEKNLGRVYDILTRESSELYKLYQSLPFDHPAKPSLYTFFESSEQVRTAAIHGLALRLSVFKSKKIKGITNTNDIDLEELGKTKCIYYLITSDQDSSLSFLSSLFFSLLFIKLTAFADRTKEQTLPVPVNMILDEFNNIGRIGSAPDGSDFARTLSTCRSRGIRMLICVQSLGQLQNRYQGTLWAEIVGNCDIQICLASNDEITSKYFSEKSGEATIDVYSTRVQRRTFAIAQVIPEYTETEGKGRRYVYTMNEVESMDGTEMLVVTSGQQILKLNKCDYTKHPMSKKIVQESAYTYIPERLQDMMAVAAEQVKDDTQTEKQNGKKKNKNANKSGQSGNPSQSGKQTQPKKNNRSLMGVDDEAQGSASSQPKQTGNNNQNKGQKKVNNQNKPRTEEPVMIGTAPTNKYDF